MTTDLETSIEYYKELLLYQYINEPKARGVIGLLVSQALVDLLPISLEISFNIETAIGNQLDILGEYIGFNRVINTAINRDYMTFNDDVMPITDLFGFTDYTDPLLNANAEMLAYVNYNSASLTDSEYRILLQLKALLNISPNTLYDMNAFIYDFFGTNLILCDQTDMTISYFVKAEQSRIISIAYEQNLLPKPMGVLISGVFSVNDPIKVWGFFDYQYNNNMTVSFSDYQTGTIDSHFLSYLDRV